MCLYAQSPREGIDCDATPRYLVISLRTQQRERVGVVTFEKGASEYADALLAKQFATSSLSF
jgi:hypothetical protein